MKVKPGSKEPGFFMGELFNGKDLFAIVRRMVAKRTGTEKKSELFKSDFQRTFFGIFWALAVMMNSFRQGAHLDRGLIGIISILLYASAAILLMKPSSTFRLLTVASIGSIEFFFRLPQMPNHFLMIGIINIALLLAATIKKLKGRFTEEWFHDSAPYFRLLFVTIYGSAAFAKLNSGFFTLQTSCAYVLANREFAWLGFNIDFNDYSFFPVLISATEILIFLGLLFRRTQPYSVILACLFHTSLSLTPVSQGLGFTFALYGFIILFISNEAKIESINKARIRQVKLDQKVPMDVFKMLYAILVIAIALAFLVTSINHFMYLAIRWLLTLLILVILTVGLIYLTFKFRRNKIDKPVFAVKGLTQFTILILVILTCLSPYLGVKTRPTFTMYSNLTVENNSTNHFIMPRFFHDSLADDVVTIVDSSNADLRQDAKEGVKWIYLELQRAMKDSPNTSITFVRDGKTHTLEKASDDQNLINPNPILAKLLSFRKVYPYDYCSW